IQATRPAILACRRGEVWANRCVDTVVLIRIAPFWPSACALPREHRLVVADVSTTCSAYSDGWPAASQRVVTRSLYQQHSFRREGPSRHESVVESVVQGGVGNDRSRRAQGSEPPRPQACNRFHVLSGCPGRGRSPPALPARRLAGSPAQAPL